VCAVFPSVFDKYLGVVLNNNGINNVFEEANNTMRGHVKRTNDFGGLNKSFARWIMF
jgi:hypothetical protein